MTALVPTYPSHISLNTILHSYGGGGDHWDHRAKTSSNQSHGNHHVDTPPALPHDSGLIWIEPKSEPS